MNLKWRVEKGSEGTWEKELKGEGKCNKTDGLKIILKAALKGERWRGKEKRRQR